MHLYIAKCVACLAVVAGALTPNVRADQLVIAFSLDTPPYVMDHGKSGIEIDIVRTALKLKGYTFSIRQMTYGELADAVDTKDVDAAATVTKMNNGTFYSENYITFRNAAITKQNSGLKIDSIADLKGKSIVAWQNAYEDLGPEFQALFSPKIKAPYRKKYREIANQKQQVEMFWKGEAQVIVIGESVMQWFTKELANKVDTAQPLVYHWIFPPKTAFRISFKSAKVRDDFNVGLNEIRKSGAYKKICEKYLK